MKKKVTNEMSMQFTSDSRNESFARYAVTSFISQLDPAMDELADLRTAVSEAVTNSIIHGYKGVIGVVKVGVRLYDDRSVRIKISDKGCGIEDVEQAMQPLYTTDSSGERGGMGFAIMQSFSDHLSVKSKVGIGTQVVMVKKLK